MEKNQNITELFEKIKKLLSKEIDIENFGYMFVLQNKDCGKATVECNSEDLIENLTMLSQSDKHFCNVILITALEILYSDKESAKTFMNALHGLNTQLN